MDVSHSVDLWIVDMAPVGALPVSDSFVHLLTVDKDLHFGVAFHPYAHHLSKLAPSIATAPPSPSFSVFESILPVLPVFFSK